MSMMVLLFLIILLCAIGLAWLLFPPENITPTQRAAKKGKTPATPKKARTKTPPRERSADEVMMARAGMTEKEAISKVVQAFVAENPATSAKILRNWLREK